MHVMRILKEIVKVIPRISAFVAQHPYYLTVCFAHVEEL